MNTPLESYDMPMDEADRDISTPTVALTGLKGRRAAAMVTTRQRYRTASHHRYLIVQVVIALIGLGAASRRA